MKLATFFASVVLSWLATAWFALWFFSFMSLSGYRSDGNDWLAVKAYSIAGTTALFVVISATLTFRLISRLRRVRADAPCALHDDRD